MKKVLSLVLVFVMVFSAMVSAGEFDFLHRTDESKNYTLKEIFKKDGVLKFIALNKADYFVELDKKYYSYQEAIEVAKTPVGGNLDITAMVKADLLTAVEKPFENQQIVAFFKPGLGQGLRVQGMECEAFRLITDRGRLLKDVGIDVIHDLKNAEFIGWTKHGYAKVLDWNTPVEEGALYVAVFQTTGPIKVTFFL